MLTFSFHAHQILGFGAYAYILISFTSDAAFLVLLFQLQIVFNIDFLATTRNLYSSNVLRRQLASNIVALQVQLFGL